MLVLQVKIYFLVSRRCCEPAYVTRKEAPTNVESHIRRAVHRGRIITNDTRHETLLNASEAKNVDLQ